MKPKIFTLLLLTSITMWNSCFLNDDCDGTTVEQLLRFGEYPVKIDSRSDTLSIGDSIRFRVELPTTFFDSIGLKQIEIEDVEIGFYVTRDTEEPKDTSLIYIFDEYFDIVLYQGEQLDPYHFKLKKDKAGFYLDFYYVCKKALKYYIPIRFDKITAKGVDTNCMIGDTRTWNATISVESEYNTLGHQADLGNYFGFVVQ